MSGREGGTETGNSLDTGPERRTVVLLLAAALVVASVGAYVFVVGPALDGGRTDSPRDGVGPTTTAPPADGGSGATATVAGTSTEAGGVDFAFVIDRIERCGQRCRGVTVTLTNTGLVAASNVQVTTRIFTGAHKIWQGQSDLDVVDAGESVTRTRRVEIGYVDAARIKSNDGYIRIETTVTWDGGSATFTDRRKVA